jgi:hypothetical protein
LCGVSHQDIYYRRFDTDGLPAKFDLLKLMKNNWFSDGKISGNTFNVDFKLYSTYADAVADTNAWTFCNFDDPTVGFPRVCGPTGYVGWQWSSFVRTERKILVSMLRREISFCSRGQKGSVKFVFEDILSSRVVWTPLPTRKQFQSGPTHLKKEECI